MSSPAAVPKPSSAGSGTIAIANTKRAYVNVRNGPGTEFQDIGDILDHALVVYFPNTATSENWVWVEHRGLRGWIFAGVVDFEPAVGNVPQPGRASTPYDGKIALWHWKGDSIPETSIQQLASNVKRRTPNVKQIWVKTSDGSDWQGDFDSSSMAINDPSSVDQWVQTLEQNGMEFHAWCVPKGRDINAETDKIIAVCQRPGVKSMILDIEPYAGFWEGGKEAIRPFMIRIRQAVRNDFHIAMSMDPRPWHYNSIFPEEWFPFINSLHPQLYWHTFRRDVEEVLQEAYDTWGNYGRPIIPALQGDAEQLDQIKAHVLITQRHGAQGVSWWRYGVISQWGAINLPIEIDTSPADPIEEPTDNFADEVLITTESGDFRSGTYTNRNEFTEFQNTWGWKARYTSTEVSTSKVWAEWKTDLPADGRYEISVFIPARHATSQRARYKIHGIRGTNTEVVVDINQSRHRNTWVALGIFELEKDAPNAGKVFLNDVTGEVGKEIAFDAIRWRRIVTLPPNNPPVTDPNQPGPGPNPGGPDVVDGVFVADGYDSPVGTDEQRRGSRVWPQGWLDASPFGRLYFVGTPSEAYHTGADLNFGSPYQDKGMPVYAPASGVVTFAASLRVWGNVIIIRHDPLYTPNGSVLYSRFGHVQDMKVKAGQRVTRGQQICEIGDAFGRFVPHLHYDLSPTTILETRPSDWPGKNQAALLKNYINPLSFTRRNRP